MTCYQVFGSRGLCVLKLEVGAAEKRGEAVGLYTVPATGWHAAAFPVGSPARAAVRSPTCQPAPGPPGAGSDQRGMVLLSCASPH